MTAMERLSSALADRYRIERRIGEGGMATVYLAHDLRHDRKVALKVLKPELAAVVGAQRFLHEIRVIANLQHPHILPLFESGEVDGSLFYAMPYVEGESLRQRIGREGPLPVPEATRLLREVADALAYAHSRNLVHRDIKPDNVMVAGRHATVTDFGVARAVDAAAEGAQITTAGMAVGTPMYMAPEQAVADPEIDHRVDIYAFGVLAYETLTGAPPFEGGPQQVIAAHLNDPPEPIDRRREDLPPVLIDVVMRSLEKNKEDRWASADEIVQRLELLDSSDEVLAAGRAKRGRAWLAALLVAVLLVAVAIGSVLTRSARSAPDVSSSSVAVMPFTVRGPPDIEYLGEGMVNLLATSLDGAGDLRSVDPRAIFALLGQDHGILTPSDGRSVAGTVGAGLYVMGDIVQTGPRITIDAALYEHGGDDPIATASAVGDASEMLALVDRLTTQLLASGAVPAFRVTELASVTTGSISALKAYLEGEREFRAGRYQRAVDAFQEAVAADSQFALALYRLSVAAEWALQPDLSQDAVDRALLHADRLSEHDRRLFQAMVAARRGESGEAERLLRSIVATWPQDVEAWIQLGEVQFHYNPLEGEPMVAARPSFERVLELEPDQAVALTHLVRIAASERDTAALDSLGTRALELSPQSERRIEMAALHAIETGDSLGLARVAAQIDSAPELAIPQMVFSTAIWSDEFEKLESLVESSVRPDRSAELRAIGQVNLAYLDAIRGRWADAKSHLRRAETARPAWGLPHTALLYLQPFLTVQESELAELHDALLQWQADAVPTSGFPSGHFNIHDGRHEGVRQYLLGLLQVRRDDLRVASSHRQALDRAPADTIGAMLYGWLAGGLDAAMSLARGDSATALATLEEVRQFGNYALGLFSPFFSRASDRYLRARLLEETGRTEEAAAAYRSFEDYNFYDRIFAAPAHLRLARMSSRTGNLAQARESYERFLFLWSEADPELQPVVRQAAAELEAMDASR